MVYGIIFAAIFVFGSLIGAQCNRNTQIEKRQARQEQVLKSKIRTLEKNQVKKVHKLNGVEISNLGDSNVK